jgi:hypothetical protein
MGSQPNNTKPASLSERANQLFREIKWAFFAICGAALFIIDRKSVV